MAKTKPNSKLPFPLRLSFIRTVQSSKPIELRIRKAIRATLKALPAGVLKKKIISKKPYLLQVSLITASQIKKINRDFRKKDKATDVLSFSRLEGFPTPIPDIGDLILCWPIAKRQAKEYGATIEEEISRLTIHGVLHLFGYDHETNKADARKMFRLQDKILASLNCASLRAKRSNLVK